MIIKIKFTTGKRAGQTHIYKHHFPTRIEFHRFFKLSDGFDREAYIYKNIKFTDEYVLLDIEGYR